MKVIFSTIFALFAFLNTLYCQESLFPEDHRNLTQSIDYESMVSLLEYIELMDHVAVTRESKSAENRDLFLVHFKTSDTPAAWRLLFYGAQHGDEPAGKDALLYLIRHLADNPENLPPDVELWVMPMVNPDGVARNQRRNGNGADLNRDHTLLSQPESQALHRVFRRVMPHVAVDCHEFRRDSTGYDERGWLEWPQIMMDTANHPLFHDELYRSGLRWIEHVGGALGAAGYNFSRYVVGDAPPEGELRYSTLDTDDGRNGLGAYGGLSFIIESGIRRGADDPNADLGLRVDAYLRIFRELISFDEFRRKDLALIAESRAGNLLPKFLPNNYFWGNLGQVITPVKVIEKSTGRTLKIETANFMHERIVKRSVSTPIAYAIEADFSDDFRTLLDHHAIEYYELEDPKILTIEPCHLESTSETYDDVYNRYSGLQIVTRRQPERSELPAGSVLVPLDSSAGLRAALLLEPTLLYGLYQFERFRELVDDDGLLPVLRVVD